VRVTALLALVETVGLATVAAIVVSGHAVPGELWPILAAGMGAIAGVYVPQPGGGRE
jgi:hypothetical protein